MKLLSLELFIYLGQWSTVSTNHPRSDYIAN